MSLITSNQINPYCNHNSTTLSFLIFVVHIYKHHLLRVTFTAAVRWHLSLKPTIRRIWGY